MRDIYLQEPVLWTLVIFAGILRKQEVASMGSRIVMASKFKEQCLALVDEVARTKVSIVVTKRGRPVARVAPMEETAVRPTMGSVRLVATEDAAYFSTGETWHAAVRS
jgi:prevent-host-death family protein